MRFRPGISTPARRSNTCSRAGHAVAYTMMSFRVAYYKVHYPLEFYSVYFTVRADLFDVSLAAGRGRARIGDDTPSWSARRQRWRIPKKGPHKGYRHDSGSRVRK